MTDNVFLDTNILVYSFDNENKRKKDIALSLVSSFYEQSNYFISTQVVIEFCNIAMKKIIYTEDLNQNQIIEGIKIINPFI